MVVTYILPIICGGLTGSCKIEVVFLDMFGRPSVKSIRATLQDVFPQASADS